MKQLILFLAPFMLLYITACNEPLEIIADVIPPAEVDQLDVELLDVDVVLTWVDPTDQDLRGIKITLFNANNQENKGFYDLPVDSLSFVFKSLAPGNYYAVVQTRDKENNLSEGIRVPFVFLSEAPVNVSNVSTVIHWNVLHINWDSLTAEDFVTTVEGQEITVPVDSIIVVLNDTLKILLPATATGTVIPDLPDGRHSFAVYTHGTSGYYSGKYAQFLTPVTFGEKFVRVKGGGFDFYIARYEVTSAELRQFIVDDLGITENYAYYQVDNSKIEDDAWYKWWYGNDPKYPNEMYLLGFNTWEFNLDNVSPYWHANRYVDDGAFGRVTWEGAMLYCLLKYNGRCPTQAEWLYAAKGGPVSQGYQYAGSDDPDEAGWWGTGEPFQKPVGQKVPNELGIYDMSGNVGEILYELDDAGTDALGKTIIIGGSMGPEHFWGNEGEMFDIANPKLTDPQVVKHTGLLSNDAKWRMGIRVLIPHDEIVKLPVDWHNYEP
jgi:hypothetical protein